MHHVDELPNQLACFQETWDPSQLPLDKVQEFVFHK